MGSGKRYESEKKLNIKKLLGVVIAIAVIIMVFFSIKKLLEPKDTSKDPLAIGYYAAYEDGKWGVIDGSGKEILPFTYDEIIVVPDNTKDVFIVTTQTDFSNETYITKLINSKKEELFTNYETVEAIDNYDQNENIWYEKNVLKVKKDGKYGLINFTGSEILKCEYDEIYSLKGTTNSLILEKDGKIGLSSNVGDVIVKPEYEDVRALGIDYSYGYIVTESDGKVGLIDCNKKMVLDVIYEDITNAFSNSMYTVKEEGVLKIMNKDKGLVVDLGADYSEVTQIAGDHLVVKKSGKVRSN